MFYVCTWVAQVINAVTGGGGLQPRMMTSLLQQSVPCIQITVVEFMVYFSDSIKCVSICMMNLIRCTAPVWCVYGVPRSTQIVNK
jgi:hypothetical protein